jgi:hypothetical protein
VGKIRWREVLYEGYYDPLVSEIIFEKVQEFLQRHVDNFENVMAEGPNPKKEAPPPPAGEEGAYP